MRGRIALADGARAPAGAVLYVMARAGGAAVGPPTAVKRIANPAFPLDFSLGPEDRMMEQIPFRGPMTITARLDTDGNAGTREPTDLQGAAAGVHEPGASGVAIVLAAVSAPAPAAAAPSGAGEAITGTITLAPELADAVPPGAVLFVIARTAERGPPLAVKRIPAPSFPHAFTIGPEDRMIATMPFAGPIRITARVDADGNATSRTPGDLFGDAVDAAPGASGVAVAVDQLIGAE